MFGNDGDACGDFQGGTVLYVYAAAQRIGLSCFQFRIAFDVFRQFILVVFAAASVGLVIGTRGE